MLLTIITIDRLELGATSFDFRFIYTRFQWNEYLPISFKLLLGLSTPDIWRGSLCQMWAISGHIMSLAKKLTAQVLLREVG